MEQIQNTGPLITALYERFSRDDEQEGESNSITNQKIFLEHYAREQGFTGCRHYTDDGYSGGNFDRPGWKQLIADIKNGIVKTVIVKDMCRIGRKHIETGFYTEVYFARMGVRFIAVNNGIDNANPDSTEYAGILNIMNEWYLKDQSRKMRSAAQLKGKSGKPLAGHPCFGYTKAPADKHHWLIDPEAAQRIFHPELSGKTVRSRSVLRGLMICGECGKPMRFHAKSHDEAKGEFICATHKKSVGYAQRLCTHNAIRISVVREIVKNVIQTVSRYAITDEDGFRRTLAKQAQQAQPDSQKRISRQIRAREKRIAELEHLLKKLYEDYALGRITETRFEKLSASYEQEEAQLKEILGTEQTQLAEAQKEADRTEQFLALARNYRDCAEITDDMILAFVEKIVVHKTVRSADGQKTRQIEVHLSFIGQFVLPQEAQEVDGEQ